MDIGGVKWAPAAASPPLATRLESVAGSAKPVATELPRDETVRAVRGADTARSDRRSFEAERQASRDELLRNFIKTRNVVDPRSREIVTRQVDTRTGDVVNQYPDETRLKLREYLNQMRERSEQATTTGQRNARSA
jgi:flagellar protein FlaG